MSKEDKDYLRKMLREQQENRERRERERLEKEQRQFDEEMGRGPDIGSDKAFERDLERIIGADYDQIQKIMQEAMKDPTSNLHQAAKRYSKIKGKDHKKQIKKIVKQNEKAFKAAAKESKDKGGICSLILLMILGTAGLMVWGAVEAVAAIMR